MSLYFISVGNKLFSTHLAKNKSTCLIALTNKHAATRLKNHIVKAQRPLDGVDYNDYVSVETLDQNSREFQKMMKVNNFSLLLANDFHIDSITNEYEFRGDAIFYDHPIDFHTVQHLDALFNKK